MRRVLLTLGTLLALSAAAVLLVPVLLKDRVIALLLAEINARVDADVSFASADVTLLRTFPDLTLAVTGLKVGDIARVGSLDVTLDLASVVGGGAVRVTGLALADTDLHVIVDTKPSEPAPTTTPDAPSTTELWLRDVAITDLSVVYEDRVADRRVEVKDLDLAGDAEVGGELVAMRSKLDIAAVTVRDGAVTWLDEAKVGGDLDVRYGPETGKVQLGDSTLRVNALALAMAGTVTPEPAGTALDLTFSAAQTTFGGLLSLIPGAYTPDFGGVKADGALKVSGAVKGLVPNAGDDLPAFDLAIGVADGSFQYPGMPASVSDIQLDLALRHPGGPADALVVDVPRFRVAVDGAPLAGRLSLRTPVSDPAIDTSVKGTLDLGRLGQAFPESVVGWTGRLDIDLDLAGKVSAFQAGLVDDVRAAGTFKLTDAVWTDPDQPLPITIEELSLAVDPKALDLAAFRLRFGQSDLAATGRVENAVAWALSDGVLVGKLDARSTMLDLNPWSGDDTEGTPSTTPTKGDTGESSLFVVPTNLDLALTVDLARVLYDEWDLRDVKGRARVKDGTMSLDNLKARTLGGDVGINGTYRAPTEDSADVDLRVTAAGLGASETLSRFETMRKILPGIENVTGKVRTGFGVQARLGRDLAPDLESLASVGKLGAIGVKLESAFMEPIAEFLGDERYKSLGLQDGDIGFEVKGGKLRLDRVPVSVGPAKGELRGKTGVLDDSLDLDLRVAMPTSAVKGGAKALAAIPGGQKVDTLDVTAKIGGTWKAPKVKVGLGDTLTEVVEEQVAAVVSDLVARAKEQGDALVAEAEKQADKLRDEAKRQVAKLRTEADRQGAKLVKEAKGNPLKEAAAKEAAKLLKKEADTQADKLDREADKQADAAIATAKKERDRLVREAERKVER